MNPKTGSIKNVTDTETLTVWSGENTGGAADEARAYRAASSAAPDPGVLAPSTLIDFIPDILYSSGSSASSAFSSAFRTAWPIKSMRTSDMVSGDALNLTSSTRLAPAPTAPSSISPALSIWAVVMVIMLLVPYPIISQLLPPVMGLGTSPYSGCMFILVVLISSSATFRARRAAVTSFIILEFSAKASLAVSATVSTPKVIMSFSGSTMAVECPLDDMVCSAGGPKRSNNIKSARPPEPYGPIMKGLNMLGLM